MPSLPDRRAFVTYFSSIGLGSSLLPGLLWARVAAGEEITVTSIAAAEELAGLSFSDEQRQMMLSGIKANQASINTLHAQPLDNSVAPAVMFNPIPPGFNLPTSTSKSVRLERRPLITIPNSLEDIAFAPVADLAPLLKTRKVSSRQLTEMYLARLERINAKLNCVVTLVRERALERARAADEEITRGRYRGPLHGIPWGVKDLFAVRGYPTTWGAGPYRSQSFDYDATVVERLDQAGAVLIAKLATGELAQGDQWFGGRTNNPWKLDQGSSGSSAGPGSATAGGGVGFAIGTETLGSISSPATRNGVTGLRPTFGRVPRTGAMALSWSMDKAGPMCRSVEDCALVFSAIQGPDGKDLSTIAAPFTWDAYLPLKGIRVGYFRAAFETPATGTPQQQAASTRSFDRAALDVMAALGVELVPVDVPDMPYGAMRLVLSAEAAAAFDDLTRSGRDKELTGKGAGDWHNSFRVSRFIPAVEYINANRLRSVALQRWHELFQKVDVILTPTGGNQLTATNLTGHPAVILPNGFRDDGTPVSITFLGGLYDEARLLRVAHAYQSATSHHTKHPTL